jgi:hypothetical protein
MWFYNRSNYNKFHVIIVEGKHIILGTDDSWVLTSNYKGIGNPKLAS